MSFEEILKAMQESADIKLQLQSQFLNKESVANYLEGDEGKRLLQPMMDKRVTTAIDTWKNNNLNSEIDKALVERGFVETPEQKQLREMKEEIANMRKEKELAELKTSTLSRLTAEGLPASALELVLADNEETINTRIELFKTNYTTEVQKAVNNKVANTGAKPAVKPVDDKYKNIDIMKLSYAERNKLHQENPDLFNKLMGL